MAGGGSYLCIEAYTTMFLKSHFLLQEQVRMVTGDNIQTAKAIALECGILDADDDASESTIIEGRTFRELPEHKREEVAATIKVCIGKVKAVRHFFSIYPQAVFSNQHILNLLHTGNGKVIPY